MSWDQVTVECRKGHGNLAVESDRYLASIYMARISIDRVLCIYLALDPESSQDVYHKVLMTPDMRRPFLAPFPVFVFFLFFTGSDVSPNWVLWGSWSLSRKSGVGFLLADWLRWPGGIKHAGKAWECHGLCGESRNLPCFCSEYQGGGPISVISKVLAGQGQSGDLQGYRLIELID